MTDPQIITLCIVVVIILLASIRWFDRKTKQPQTKKYPSQTETNLSKLEKAMARGRLLQRLREESGHNFMSRSEEKFRREHFGHVLVIKEKAEGVGFSIFICCQDCGTNYLDVTDVELW